MTISSPLVRPSERSITNTRWATPTCVAASPMGPGPNQKGLQAVAGMVNSERANTEVRVHFVPDYYNENGFRAWLQSQGESLEEIGTHAGISDTSQLMALNPNWIRKDRLAPGGDRKVTGVSGNPTRANVAYGRKGLEFKVEAAVAQIRTLMAARAR